MATSIIVVVFAVQLALNLISSFGAQAVNDLVWWLYTRLPSKQAKQAGENRKLRNEAARLQRELASISAQDNFAKWARTRRDLDKAKEKYEKESREQQSFRASFDSIVSKLRWLGTQGVNFVLNTWFSKEPMFWLPHGFLPHPFEWILSFPKAPLGSISVNVWAIACSTVIAMLSEAIVSIWKLRKGDVQEDPNKSEKTKVSTGPNESKKEL